MAAASLALVLAIVVCVSLALRAPRPGGSIGRLLIAVFRVPARAGILAIAVPPGLLSEAIALV